MSQIFPAACSEVRGNLRRIYKSRPQDAQVMKSLPKQNALMLGYFLLCIASIDRSTPSASVI